MAVVLHVLEVAKEIVKQNVADAQMLAMAIAGVVAETTVKMHVTQVVVVSVVLVAETVMYAHHAQADVMEILVVLLAVAVAIVMVIAKRVAVNFAEALVEVGVLTLVAQVVQQLVLLDAMTVVMVHAKELAKHCVIPHALLLHL